MEKEIKADLPDTFPFPALSLPLLDGFVLCTKSCAHLSSFGLQQWKTLHQTEALCFLILMKEIDPFCKNAAVNRHAEVNRRLDGKKEGQMEVEVRNAKRRHAAGFINQEHNQKNMHKSAWGKQDVR